MRMHHKLAIFYAAVGLATLGASQSASADPTAPCNDGAAFLRSTECGSMSTTGTAAVALAVGDTSRATADGSTAVGADSSALGGGATAVGRASRALFSAGTSLGYNAYSAAIGAIAIGADSLSQGTASIAIGGDLDGNGSGAATSAAGSIAIGADSSATADNSVALGSGSVANVANTVSVGVIGAERRVVNVAAGTNPTDAVNFGQLSGVSNALLDLSGDVGTLFNLRQSDRRDMKQGVASAMAMAQAPMPSGPGKVAYAVNGATFRGEYAVGGSLQYRLNTEAPMAVNVGASFAGNKNNGVRVGVAGEF